MSRGKLLLVLPAVRAGGAERVMVGLSEVFLDAGFEVHLATVNKGEDFFALRGGIVRHRFEFSTGSMGLRAPFVNARKLAAIRKLARNVQPTAIISFLNRMNIRVLAATMGLRIPVIVSERIAPEKTGAGPGWKVLRRLMYPKAYAVVAQTRREADWFKGFVKRTTIIENPVSPRVLSARGVPDYSSKLVVAAGRFTRQKGFDILVRAFGKVASQFKDWRLVVYGDGPQRVQLLELVRELGLEDRVAMPGTASDLLGAMLGASTFVLSSRYEGFPNVLIEAMGLGLAVVATDCPNGPREILENEVNGLLAGEPGDVEELAAKLAQIFESPEKRQQLGSAARITVADRFSPENIGAKWIHLVEEAGASK